MSGEGFLSQFNLLLVPGHEQSSPLGGNIAVASRVFISSVQTKPNPKPLPGSTMELWGKEKRGLAARAVEWIPVMCKFCFSPSSSSELPCPALDAVLRVRSFSALQLSVTLSGEDIFTKHYFPGIKPLFKNNSHLAQSHNPFQRLSV